MIIYRETKRRFIEDVEQNSIQPRLVEAFRSMTGSVPADSRVWAEEYSRFSHTLGSADVADDIQVAIEYHISAAGRFRIDVLLIGNDGRNDNGLIIELKAWSQADVSDIQDLVKTPVGGRNLHQHPCVQAKKYKGLILRFNRDVREHSIGFHAAAYLFNLHRRKPEPLEDARYGSVLEDARLFLADDVGELRRYIQKHVPQKAKKDVLYILEHGRLVPAPELIGRVGRMLEGNEEFDLIDEQNEAFQFIRHNVMNVVGCDRRQVFVVQGGPGTGKSVIAIRLLAEILKAKRMGLFVAPNAAFRNTLIEYLSRGNTGYREDGQALIQSSWSFHGVDYDKDEKHEVLIVDEAHRLKGKAYRYPGNDMVEDMVRAARTSIFFLDETQRVQWNDIGSLETIQAAAKKFNAVFHEPFQLRAQYRCNGSSGYLNWLEDVLQGRDTGNYENWGDGQYDFRVFDRAEDLYTALKENNADNKARLIAGYSWEWPKGNTRNRGTANNHVVAAGLSLPWNYANENWATSRDGIGQVGCIHTSQGLEFDWLGVLIGADLICRDGRVIGVPEKRAKTDASLKGWKKEFKQAKGIPEKEQAVLGRVQEIIKSTYKVLLSRGRKGCFVWCADSELREYLKNRLALVSGPAAEPATAMAIMGVPEGEKYRDCLPVYSLEVAAGYLDKPSLSDCLGWIKTPPGIRGTERHFVARISGKSMEPRIPDGSYAVFHYGQDIGPRSGKIVLAELSDSTDPETGGRYTVKQYQSKKHVCEDGSWEHTEITLVPLNSAFRPIEIGPAEAQSMRIVAEFVGLV